mmetsp:Transcript_132443/g.330291  ORF Transcript_132443/g.330291 Transcript_132443/m.330291 type:complete len:230 (-) Transcript_132443:267-956(-)
MFCIGDAARTIEASRAGVVAAPPRGAACAAGVAISAVGAAGNAVSVCTPTEFQVVFAKAPRACRGAKSAICTASSAHVSAKEMSPSRPPVLLPTASSLLTCLCAAFEHANDAVVVVRFVDSSNGHMFCSKCPTWPTAVVTVVAATALPPLRRRSPTARKPMLSSWDDAAIGTNMASKKTSPAAVCQDINLGALTSSHPAAASRNISSSAARSPGVLNRSIALHPSKLEV